MTDTRTAAVERLIEQMSPHYAGLADKEWGSSDGQHDERET